MLLTTLRFLAFTNEILHDTLGFSQFLFNCPQFLAQFNNLTMSKNEQTCTPLKTAEPPSGHAEAITQ